MADVFSTNILTGTINSLISAPSFLLDRFFPSVQTEESEEIHFDTILGTRQLAPFVSPKVAGQIVESKGFKTSTFKPAYIKIKTPYEPRRAFKRSAGEKIGGTVSAVERMERLVQQDLENHDQMIRRRMEVMAGEALRSGQVTVTGDDYPTQVVDFHRDPDLTIALGDGSRWGQAGVKVMDTLRGNHALILKKSGVSARDVILDTEGLALFMEDEEVKAKLDYRHVNNVAMNPDVPDAEGGVHIGTIDGFNIWLYEAWYEDASGDLQPILPVKSLIQAGSRLEGVQAYGAIEDHEMLRAVPRFTKSWLEKDPSLRLILTQAAPLVVPQRADGSCFVKVAQ